MTDGSRADGTRETSAGLDVVIPAHPKDFATLDIAVACVLRNLPEAHRVFVVSPEPYEHEAASVHHVPEPESNGFPTVSEVRTRWQAEFPELAWRAGWLYQQVLGLGAGQYIEGLLPTYVCIDADTMFLRPVKFGFKGARFVYCDTPQPIRQSYADAHRRLTGEEQLPRSFTAHHMHYDQGMLAELFEQVERLHGRAWYDAYLDSVDFSDGASINEQDTYGSWVMTHHPEAALRRPLAWTEIDYVPNGWQRRRLGRSFDFVAAHAYMRQPLTLRFKQRAVATGGRVLRQAPGIRRLIPARRG